MPIDVMPANHTKPLVCPSPDTLADYLGGWIDDDQSSAIDRHLESCETCQAAIARIESEPDSLFASVKSIASEPVADQKFEPEVEYALSRVKRLPRSDDASASNNPSNHVIGDAADRTIGPYQLIGSLGHGGMGSVYLAQHRQLKKLVAIKVLPSRWLASDAHLNRFQREIRAAGGLNHPAIVTATDAGQQGDIDYLVMEYVDGCDLSRVARLCGPLAIADACEAIRRVALGLSHAHSLGIVHRDIKPSNLMLSVTGEVKVLDFGLARHTLWDEASAELTTVGQLMGTLDYMAPEQAECAAAVDYRADLYSLGATLFRLIVGRPPLAAAPDLSPLSKLKLLAAHDSPRADTLRADVPKELANVIASLLHRDPSRRPASAAHVAEKLASFTAGNDLAKLALETKQKDKTNPPDETDAKPHLPTKPSLAHSSVGIGRWGWLVTATGFAASFLAGIFLIIETQKGQLVIESDAENVSVRLLSDGKQYDTIKVQSGATATKLFAGNYEIEIEGASDDLLIDQESVIIRKGETILAKIGRPLKQTVQQPETTKLMDEPVYDGEPLSVWLNRIATEKSSEPLYKALQAVKKLVGPTNAEQVRSSLMDIMATVADQNIVAGTVRTSLDLELVRIISESFADNKNFHEYMVEVLKQSDNQAKSRIYPQLIRVDQTNTSPLIDYLTSDVFSTETDPEIVRLAADYARNYLLLKRDSKDEIHQNLATLIYANRHLGIDFWLEYLPAENFFGYAENIQQRAIEALESDDPSDELVTQAAIFLTELHKGIGPVQVELSSDDKVRVAGRVASLLEQLAERPTEIAKLLTLSNQFANLAVPRYYSPPYSNTNIVSGPQSAPRKHGSLALELLELAEVIAQYSITDAAVNRIIDATLEPFLSIALQMEPKSANQRAPLFLIAWPDLYFEQPGANFRDIKRDMKRLSFDKADVLSYLINIAGYHALSDTGKANAEAVFKAKLTELKAKTIPAEHDQDGKATLSKEEDTISDLEVQNYDNADAKSIDSGASQYAKRIIERNDRNKDGVLESWEWTQMLVDPSAADTNRDGKITVEEYVLWIQSRQSR